jgi:hypothetical protein
MEIPPYRLVGAVVALLAGVTAAATPAHALCGKECKEAKEFCKSYEKKHPDEECGRVRGAVCIGSSWTKIKQVNWAWSACRLVKGEEDLKKAEARCKQFEENWGGNCQVHSPLCNAGWVKLGDYGKFRACRPIEVTLNMRYNAYKAFMRKFEGKADTKMHPALSDFVKKNYDLDLEAVRWGYASNTPSTCITDCTKIYCDKKNLIEMVRSGTVTNDIVFHELGHVQQCKKVGGRDDYAKMWFRDLPKGFFGALDPELDGKFKDKIHDEMPMEKDAEAKGVKTFAEYQKEWWNRHARCRVYKEDKVTIVYESSEAHARVFCDPDYGEQGARELATAAEAAARKHGFGKYYFAFGKPHANDGVWLGSGTFGTPPQRIAPASTGPRRS